MASDPNALHSFWYHPNVSLPKDYAPWDAMIAAFAKHLIARYGSDEVATWKFEVWNELNFDFWNATPKQATYFDHTTILRVRCRVRLRDYRSMVLPPHKLLGLLHS